MTSSHSSNPYGIRDSFDPNVVPVVTPDSNNGKDFYNSPYGNPDRTSQPSRPQQAESRISIDNIDQIDYYP